MPVNENTTTAGDASFAAKPANPELVAREIGAKLASRSRHVSVLIGAGAPKAAGLPGVAELKELVVKSISGDHETIAKELFEKRSLEEGISRLRTVRSLLEGDEEFDGITRDAAVSLDRRISVRIVDALDSAKADLEPFRRLASWATKSEKDEPVEIFTVNYDLLIEMGLESLGAAYFDGFVGTLTGTFRPDLIETSAAARTFFPPSFVRVWKLHGSVNWLAREIGGPVVRLGMPVKDAAAIYPSAEKYEESRRSPYVALFDRFRRSLSLPETLFLVAGYSFSDQHLNEIIFDAAFRSPRSEVVVFAHKTIPAPLAAAAEKTRNLTVTAEGDLIVGGRRVAWADHDDIPGVFEGKKWLLGDFKHLSAFLARTPGSDA